MQRKYGFQSHTGASCHHVQCIFLALALLSWWLVMSSCGLTVTVNPSEPLSKPSPEPSQQPTKVTVVPTKPVAKAHPTPTPVVLSDRQVAINFIEHYVDLVLSQLFRRAYTKLSADLRDRESYDDFVQNPNYTLDKGCWNKGQLHVSQTGKYTWVVWLEMMQVSCVDGNVMVYYSWVFHLSLADGLPEITSFGLYPTGSGS